MRVLMLATLAMAGAAAAEPASYVCTVETASGLHFDSRANAWIPQVFKPGDKFVLRKLTDADLNSEKYKYLLKLPGQPVPNWAFFDSDDRPAANCVETTGQFGTFVCREVTVSAKFDRESRRFQVEYTNGYIGQGVSLQWKREDPEGYKQRVASAHNDGTTHPDDLLIGIGHCSTDQ